MGGRTFTEILNAMSAPEQDSRGLMGGRDIAGFLNSTSAPEQDSRGFMGGRDITGFPNVTSAPKQDSGKEKIEAVAALRNLTTPDCP